MSVLPTRGKKLSESDEWSTPRPLFDELSVEVGGFVFDLAASKENARCSSYLTKDDDALRVHWHLLAPSRWLWLNPPFSKPNLPNFTDALVENVKRGALVGGVLPNSTSSTWFLRNLLWHFEIGSRSVVPAGALRGTLDSGTWHGLPARLWWLGYRPRFGNESQTSRSGSGLGGVVAFAFGGGGR